MHKRKFWLLLSLLLAFAVVFTACDGGATQATDTPLPMEEPLEEQETLAPTEGPEMVETLEPTEEEMMEEPTPTEEEMMEEEPMMGDRLHGRARG